jgi:hypothetical protein
VKNHLWKKEKQMKKVTLVLGLAMLVLLAGCSKSPTAVTKDFIKAVQKNDMSGITSNTAAEAVGFMSMAAGELRNQMGSGKYTILKEEIDGDTAVVTVKFDNDEEETFHLIKIDGKWKMTLSK